MTIRQSLQSEGFRFKKRYGQNFISDTNLLNAIVELATPNDTVLEIGAGAGSLTQQLAKKFKHVVALEIDKSLEPILTNQLKDYPNIDLHFLDAEKTDLDALMKTVTPLPYGVVANLPYYITTPLIMQLMEKAPMACELVVMVQKEVAERFVAKPKTKAYGAITVAINYAFEVEIAMQVGKKSFTPVPAVDSAVVVLRRHQEKPHQAIDEQLFRKVVRAAFGMRRKTLRNALNALDHTKEDIAQAALEANIDLNLRGEALSVEDYVRLANAFCKGGSHDQ